MEWLAIIPAGFLAVLGYARLEMKVKRVNDDRAEWAAEVDKRLSRMEARNEKQLSLLDEKLTDLTMYLLRKNGDTLEQETRRP